MILFLAYMYPFWGKFLELPRFSLFLFEASFSNVYLFLSFSSIFSTQPIHFPRAWVVETPKPSLVHVSSIHNRFRKGISEPKQFLPNRTDPAHLWLRRNMWSSPYIPLSASIHRKLRNFGLNYFKLVGINICSTEFVGRTEFETNINLIY